VSVTYGTSCLDDSGAMLSQFFLMYGCICCFCAICNLWKALAFSGLFVC
jgi:hypothetical protein